MAKGFKCGAGGGNLLNFKVVGNPQPTSPKENMIWVNTDQKITGWYFAQENPFNKTKDIYTSVGAKTNTYLKYDGTEVNSQNVKLVTDKIPLPAGTYSITLTANNVATSECSHGFYDADGNFISAVLRKTGTATYEVPSNAKSVRITVYNGDSESLIVNYNEIKEGMVWGIISTSSTVAYNALKKNGIQVYPISAKQYVGGTWVDVTAKSYQGGEWVDWIPNGALYYRGNECVHITGGWRFAYDGSNASIGTGVKNSDRIKISTSGNQAISATTVKALDLSKVNTATVNVVESINNSEENYYRAAIMLIPEGKPLEATQAVLRYTIPKVISNPLRVDVSGIKSGRHFICVYLRYESGSHSLTFDEVMTT